MCKTGFHAIAQIVRNISWTNYNVIEKMISKPTFEELDSLEDKTEK